MARGGNDQIILNAAALGAISGLRSLAAPALLAHELAGRGRADGGLERLITSEAFARLLALVASGEMLADKAPFMPDRTSPLPLLGRALIGSLTAAAYASHRHHPVLLPAVAGAVAALASTRVAFQLRRDAGERFHVPDRLLGMIEDAIVVAASRALAARIRDG
jgi:uncharacterized membrane protein